jgi:hypothetical protein
MSLAATGSLPGTIEVPTAVAFFPLFFARRDILWVATQIVRVCRLRENRLSRRVRGVGYRKQTAWVEVPLCEQRSLCDPMVISQRSSWMVAAR